MRKDLACGFFFKRHVRKILLCECVGQSCEKGSCSWNVRVCFEKAVL